MDVRTNHIDCIYYAQNDVVSKVNNSAERKSKGEGSFDEGEFT